MKPSVLFWLAGSLLLAALVFRADSAATGKLLVGMFLALNCGMMFACCRSKSK